MTEELAKDDTARSIRIAQHVCEALDADAKRCRRSSTKQLEAILAAYYRLDEKAPKAGEQND